MSDEKKEFTRDDMPDPNVPVRDVAEITIAHDIINSILLLQVPYPLDPFSTQMLHFYQDVLCWVLRHDHKNHFAENLKIMKDNLESMGYKLMPLDRVMTAGEVSEQMIEEGTHYGHLSDNAENN
jgi:hypothetical protein